jgi:STE24 endopeptidase
MSRWQLLVLLALAALLAMVGAAQTPWHPLGDAPPVVADPAADFTPAELARERAYHRQLRPFQYAALGMGLSVALLLGATRLGARLIGALARRLGGVLAASVVVGLAGLSTLPLDAAAEGVERRFGLSVQTWPGWLADQGRGLAIGAPLLVAGLAIFYALVRRFPRSFWLPTGVLAALFAVAISLVAPVVIRPLFNRFTSLPPGPLRSRLLALAQRDGTDLADVLVSDASRRTTALNAYVDGFGPTRRLVLYDTLLASSSPAQIERVVAHELGHVRHHDVLWGTLGGALTVLVGAGLLQLLLGRPRLLARAGVVSAGDPRSAALLSLLLMLGGLAAAPSSLLVSRRVEARADVHSLDLTADPQGFIEDEHVEAVRDLEELEPGPLAWLLSQSHPSSPQRIAQARAWAAQHGVPVPPPRVGR